jgi:hypothetical protein
MTMLQNKIYNYKIDDFGQRSYESKLTKNKKQIANKNENENLESKEKKEDEYNIRVEYNFNLDPFLTTDYHNRHGISKSDIKKILKFCSPDQLWMATMLYGQEIKITTKYTNLNLDDLNWTRTRTEIDNVVHTTNAKKVLEEFFLKSKKLKSLSPSPSSLSDTKTKTNANTVDKLILKNDEHQPPLPVHFVSLSLLKSCFDFQMKENHYLKSLRILLLDYEEKQATDDDDLIVVTAETRKKNKSNKSNSRNQDYIFQNKLIRWKDIDILPFGVYKRYLKMVRVIPKKLYQSIYGIPKNDISRPTEYLVDGSIYCGLNKEFMLLQTKQGHEYLSSLPNTKTTKENDHLIYLEESEK